MAPIRRYLRITKYSVLEVRIYLHKPSDAAWLLSTRDPVLPRILKAVRPKVLPKLREENENAKKKGSKKKRGIKDVASQHDFEVSIFLKETSTRHSLLTKQKRFTDPAAPRLRSTGRKLTGWLNPAAPITNEQPIDLLDDDDDDDAGPAILREEDVDDNTAAAIDLSRIPDVHATVDAPPPAKRRRTGADADANTEDALFVGSDDDGEADGSDGAESAAGKKRRRKNNDDDDDDGDDKKKLALDTTYDGFSIYGRILCLIVTRKGGGRRGDPHRPATAAVGASRAEVGGDSAGGGGGDLGGLGGGASQMMEQWVSTQAAQENGMDDDDDEG